MPSDFSFSIIFWMLRLLLLLAIHFDGRQCWTNKKQKNKNAISRLLLFFFFPFHVAGCRLGDNEFSIFITFDSVYLSILENVFRDPRFLSSKLLSANGFLIAYSSANAPFNVHSDKVHAYLMQMQIYTIFHTYVWENPFQHCGCRTDAIISVAVASAPAVIAAMGGRWWHWRMNGWRWSITIVIVLWYGDKIQQKNALRAYLVAVAAVHRNLYMYS